LISTVELSIEWILIEEEELSWSEEDEVDVFRAANSFFSFPIKLSSQIKIKNTFNFVNFINNNDSYVNKIFPDLSLILFSARYSYRVVYYYGRKHSYAHCCCFLDSPAYFVWVAVFLSFRFQSFLTFPIIFLQT